ncbi:MAG: DUF2254 domain-containing protein [Acidimicrobiales bacterium]|jgi:uncharacterized membrane protein|nr:DUF2254 domain-containing protein [Acidimicrobiales bacterium]
MTTWTRRGRLRQYLDTAVWPVPAAYLLVACVLGAGVPALDRVLGDAVPAEFGVGAAQAVLAAFATGLITVMGFIISVVLAGLTFGSTTVTPRIVRELQRNTTIRHVFGLFLLSVVYAFLVLNRVAPPSDPNYVPDLAVWLVVPLLVLDVVALFVLVREMGHTLRLVEIIDRVHHRAERVIATIYREPLGADVDRTDVALPSVAPAVIIRNEEGPGVVANLNVESLVAEAVRVDTTVTLACAIGSYVPSGRALLHVADAHPGLDGQRLRDAITLADERTIDQDPLYALRLLVDIATRALSPAVNDPTTAVQTLDRIEAILELLANRRLDQGTIRDDHGKVRLIIPLPSWEDFLAVSLTEIRHYGATSAQVMRRQRALLDDLILDAPPSRRPALQEQLTLLDQTIARSWPDPTERELALVADRHGLGEPGAVRGPNRPQAQVLARDAALPERHD